MLFRSEPETEAQAAWADYVPPGAEASETGEAGAGAGDVLSDEVDAPAPLSEPIGEQADLPAE